jgi:hypothetical protein
LSSAESRFSEGAALVVLLTRCGKFPKIDELLVAGLWVVLEAFELRFSEGAALVVLLTTFGKFPKID